MNANLLRRYTAGECLLVETDHRSHFFEDAIVLPPFVENVGSIPNALAARLKILPLDRHQPLRLDVRERPKHHRIDYAEDGAGRPYAQGQAERRYRRNIGLPRNIRRL